jgi:two-component system, NtrC family, nitrogen regulation sensor histidine kinase NtrY
MLKPADISLPAQIRGLSGPAAFLLVTLGTLIGLATFLLLTGVTPIKPDDYVVRSLLITNAVLVVLMIALVAGQLVMLLRAYRRGTPGTGLHIRLISLFSLIAIVPALLVAVFAGMTLNRGLDYWFSERTRAIVETATTVADAYLKNATEATRSDLANISADLTQQAQLYESDKPAFSGRMRRHAVLRNLAAIYLIDAKEIKIDTKYEANDSITFLAPGVDALALANRGDMVLIPAVRGGNLVRALIKLQGHNEKYLYIYRVVSSVVIDQLEKTREAKLEYDALLAQRTSVQLTFALAYALVAMVFLLAAIWAGIWFSNRLVAPLVRLLSASREVADGNLGAKVVIDNGPGDLMVLSRTFNQMTNQLQEQRKELVTANEQLDERRRFTEAVLAGVSAGVIGVEDKGTVSLVNRSAQQLLGLGNRFVLGEPLESLQPAFKDLYETAKSRPSGAAIGQITTQIHGRDVTLLARLTTERSDSKEHGYVLTFDDISELVTAQRNSAWADIARRIAHEIKNPLTPIQLSAERLKRKYLKEISSDRHVFEQCTDTIIRQVGDLGRIVDEFSSFARMPKALREPNNLIDVVRDSTVLQRVSASDIDIDLLLGNEPVKFEFDRRLVTQAITNLVKNAREAIEGRALRPEMPRGHIEVTAGVEDATPFVHVVDNGVGLPQENRHRLAEPYMTTREKGTGLGLAIVKRIMEEHGGKLELKDSPSGIGASVTLWFEPLPQDNKSEPELQAEASHGS